MPSPTDARERAREIGDELRKRWEAGSSAVDADYDLIAQAIADARREERERCLDVVETRHDALSKRSYPAPKILAELADAIRSLPLPGDKE